MVYLSSPYSHSDLTVRESERYIRSVLVLCLD